MSRVWLILFQSLNKTTVGIFRNVLQLFSPKWFSICRRYRSAGRSPFFPSSCLFWLAATENATTGIQPNRFKVKIFLTIYKLFLLYIFLTYFYYCIGNDRASLDKANYASVAIKSAWLTLVRYGALLINKYFYNTGLNLTVTDLVCFG